MRPLVAGGGGGGATAAATRALVWPSAWGEEAARNLSEWRSSLLLRTALMYKELERNASQDGTVPIGRWGGGGLGGCGRRGAWTPCRVDAVPRGRRA